MAYGGFSANYSLRGRRSGFGELTSFTVRRLNDLRNAVRSTAFAHAAACGRYRLLS
jgi:hypothetical protein